MINTNDTTAMESYSIDYCPNRLPCGVCKLMQCCCPKGYWQPNVTWTVTSNNSAVSSSDVKTGETNVSHN